MRQANHVRFISVLFLSAFATQSFGAAHDYKYLQKLVNQIAKEVITAEEARDPRLKGQVEELGISIDHAQTDLSKNKFSITALAALKTSTWKPGEKASVVLKAVASEHLDPKRSDPSLKGEVSLALETDVAAFVRFAAVQLTAWSDPCSEQEIRKGRSKREIKFNEDACQDIPKLSKVKTTGEALDLIQSIASKWEAYAVDRSAELKVLGDAASERELKSLAEELKVGKSLVESLKKRTDKNSWTYSIGEIVGIAETKTDIKDIVIAMDSKKASVQVVFDSPEALVMENAVLPLLEDYLSKLEKDDSDADKQAAVKELREGLRGLLELSKEVILFKPKN